MIDMLALKTPAAAHVVPKSRNPLVRFAMMSRWIVSAIRFKRAMPEYDFPTPGTFVRFFHDIAPPSLS